jgi:hypothetical protein
MCRERTRTCGKSSELLEDIDWVIIDSHGCSTAPSESARGSEDILSFDQLVRMERPLLLPHFALGDQARQGTSATGTLIQLYPLGRNQGSSERDLGPLASCSIKKSNHTLSLRHIDLYIRAADSKSATFGEWIPQTRKHLCMMKWSRSPSCHTTNPPHSVLR